ncbi:hypothetical protein [Natrialbaceae archaeon AArc-T1-2]|uniref:hypothetical protein n=1 Tax=Natrialbaceae archaeon AArc-T1-2 TaxID=3053904 RepID=UPI00255B11E5|nr:hypothetical protein [Natrialbaceae archaeon AArc-T1-2]WIV67548.1 hypothetical protein QQ977_02115 [Natrialbaceae archaeon AArc-T1-2]
MGVRDQIRNSEEYQQIVAEQSQQQQQHASSPGEAVAPVVSLEKTDLHFLTQLAILFMLVLIYRELTSRGEI